MSLLPRASNEGLDLSRGGAEPLTDPAPWTGRRRFTHPGPEGLPPPEIREAHAWRVSCDGGEGALGHPRVWLSIPHETGFIDCGYCDARFVHVDHLADHAGGDPVELAQRGSPSAPGQPGDHTQPADRKEDVAGRQPVDGSGDMRLGGGEPGNGGG